MKIPSKYILLPILAVNFIGALGFSLVIPFLVFWVNRFGGNAVIYGLLGASYSFFQLIGAPWLGRLSDRVGRRKVLFFSHLGTLLSLGLLLVALNVPITPWAAVDSWGLGSFLLTLPLLLLFLARSFDGLTGGNISVANAYLVDVSIEKDQASNFGKMAAASNLGFILGPAIAGIFGGTRFGENLPIAAAIGISAVGLALILFLLPESRPKPLDRSPCSGSTPRVLGKENKDCFESTVGEQDFFSLIRRSGMKSLLLLYFLIFLGFNIFYAAFPLHAATDLRWSFRQLGIFFSVLSAMMIFVQGPLLAFLSRRISEKVLALVGAFLMGVSFVCLAQGEARFAYISAIFFALGNGTLWPSYLSILAKAGSKESQGYLQGVAASVGSAASILGLVVGGVLYSRFGTQTFLLCTVVFLVSLVVMRMAFRHPSKNISLEGKSHS